MLAACVLWAVDNNPTRRVSLTDETWLAAVKGAVAGTVNLGLALLTGSALPALPVLLAAGALGLVSYGISLVLFGVALRDLGVARTGACFSVTPSWAPAWPSCWATRHYPDAHHRHED